MATRTCPSCGTQYVATVRRCIDCELTLVDDVEAASVAVGAEPEATAETGASEQRMAELPLTGWGNQLKVTLEGMLDRAEIPHAWEAGVLVLPRVHLDEANELISVVEGSDVSDVDEESTMVALEIEGLDAAGLELLDGRLAATSVPHAWSDEGELIVAEADEEQVLEIIQDVFDEEGDDVGLDAAERLTALYVAADRLVRRVGDRKFVAAFVDAAEAIGSLDVPYGLDGETWAAVSGSAARLAEQLGGGGSGGDEDPVETEDAGGSGDSGDDEGAVAEPGDDGAGGNGSDEDDRLRADLVDLRDTLREMV